MTKTKPWNRILWGVKLVANTEPLLIGKGWMRGKIFCYDGEPTQALLFTTRKNAQAWCREKQATCNATWKFIAVRVREIVTEL